jgi:serine/threonine protein kinase
MTATINCAGCQHAYTETALFCPNCGRPKVRDAHADPLLGKLLGERFLVQERLGQGGSGTIYRAEHVTLRRKVAIKVLHAELSRDDLAVERFRREATTVAEIDNEHIVEIHDFGRAPDGRLYLAMELLEGGTLDAVLEREKQLSVERVADILIQVGEALMEAHAIGYVHRDLRPRNIYLSVRRGKANFIKLLDFGLAKLVETEGEAASTSLGMTFGDPRYMSPEQARGDRIDRRADIYQLGCVAYEMLTGAPPFSGGRVFDILTKQVTEAPQPLPTRRPGVPLWMEAAVTKMLAKDPANRFATTTRMVEALRRGLDTGEVMEDEVARRRESIPPPSVSRVMQRMGIAASGEPQRTLAQADTPVAGAPLAPAPPVLPTPAPPVLPASAPAAGRVAPGVTMQASSVPPPARPDSVELLRKRTGTPKLGVPVPAPAPAPAAGHASISAAVHASVAAADAQSPVAGLIDPAAARPAGTRAPHDPASHADPGASPVRSAASSTPSTPLSSSSSSSSSSRSARGVADGDGGGPAADLNISQVWYDEGDQLSGDDDTPSARRERARKTISPSATDLAFYDERPRRRWGLFIAAGMFVAIGGTVAFALTRGSSSPPHAPAMAAAAAEAAPSTIIPTDPPAGDVAAVPLDAGTAAKPPTTGHRPAETHAPAEVHAPARAPSGGRQPADLSFPVPGSEPTRRLPGAGSGTVPAVVTSPVTPPGSGKGSGAAGLTDSPKDPYGSEDPPSGDGVAPEKKAEFFANLGAQQLINSDMVGAAGNFKKALELDGKNVAATMGMGEIALRQGLFGDAIVHLSKATKLSPRSAKAFTLLGDAYLSNGNNTQAAAQFKKALGLDPDNARARDGYNEASSHEPPPTDEAP